MTYTAASCAAGRRRHSRSKSGLAPRVLAGPAPLGNGFATVEEYVARGVIRNGHDPVVRRALAESLSRVIECLMASANDSRLPPGLLISIAPDALWPRPHSKLFDFDATRAGAQYIDEIAATARGRFAPLGRQVIGHLDWRAEHVRFDGDSPTAYTSRCGHAAGLDLRNQPGTFHHLLWSAGPRLLELCG